MHQALYRKWRPKDFDDVCGQEHVTSILKYEVAAGKTSHAYLFCGSRGTGKTSCAKILAKAINCEHPNNGNPCNACPSCLAIDQGTALDVYEMDAASNNGIDNIRDIRDEVLYTPSELRNRVYIIDEVHMLSTSAFNALLKTLEEPPENVVFILATTELQKIPATILSRCQRFEFRRIKTQIIADRLLFIASKENIKVTPQAAFLIAKLSQGGMRDAISMLELCSGENGEITEDTVTKVTGTTGRTVVFEAFSAILEKDFDKLFGLIDRLHTSSTDISVFWSDLIAFYRDLFVCKNVRNAKSCLDLTEGEYEELTILAKKINNASLHYQIKTLEEAYNAMFRPNSNKRITAELCLIRLCDNRLSTDDSAIIDRISALEDKVSALSARPAPSFPEKGPEKENTASPETEAKDNDASLRQIAGWAEIVKKFSKTDMSIASYLTGCKGYLTGKGAIIKAPGSFTAQILSQTAVKENLAALISSEENAAVDPKNITITTESANADDGSDGMDDLLKNISEK